MNLKKKLGAFFTLTRKSSGGFTLVELIVVIAILAILAGVAIPAYGGYVKKANKAADEQLLAALNKAFVSACLTNGESNYDRTDVSAAIDADGNATVTVSGISGFEEAFAGLYEGGQFKVFTGALKYNPLTGMIEVPTAGKYAHLSGTFNDEDITKFNSSVFASLGVSSLMGQVDMATQLVAGAESGPLYDMVHGAASQGSVLEYLGKGNIDDGYAVFAQLLEEKMAQLAAAEGGDPASYEDRAGREIMANYAVLNAATNSDFDKAAFKAALANGTAIDAIKNSNDGTAGTQAALAQTAMAYAMYTSYVSRNGGTATSDVGTVLETLRSPDFQDYVNNTGKYESTNYAEQDLNGYLSAMSMIEEASGDTEAASALLLNGFTDPELIALLNQEIGG